MPQRCSDKTGRKFSEGYKEYPQAAL